MENKKYHDQLKAILLSLLLVHVSSFNISVAGGDHPFSTSPPFSANITATWCIKFHIINPNTIFSNISYEPLEVSVNYGNYKIASALTPPFFQDTKTHHASVLVEASSKSIDNLVAYQIAMDHWVHGVVNFNVRAYGRVHLGPLHRFWVGLVKEVEAICNYWKSSETLYAKINNAGRKALRLRLEWGF
ncbi:hypothetical protein GH714_014153 [Hevea brasiliensis]|uniref:Late embryogenesis abundant protein LEA-2 subgroup domain-containing protein n=1 Tax=Hevea brasiliensis TaxID=3981 RepID=A0A6A6KL75_HEVBR|nr:hypothetical protein GH714_014153 [Hevea brasiliensis]